MTIDQIALKAVKNIKSGIESVANKTANRVLDYINEIDYIIIRHRFIQEREEYDRAVIRYDKETRKYI